MRSITLVLRPVIEHLFNYVWFRLTMGITFALFALIALIAAITSRFDLGDLFLFVLFGFMGALQLMRSYVLLYNIRKARQSVSS